MSQGNPISGTESVSSTQTTPSASTLSTDPVTQAGAAQSGGKTGTVDSKTKISSMAELRTKAPEVWQKMLEGIAMNICNEMRRHQEEIKTLRREYEKNS